MKTHIIRRKMAFWLAVCGMPVLAGCATTSEAEPPESPAARETSSSISETTGAAAEDLPELSAEATLQEYLAYAALNNPGLRSAFERWRAALEQAPQVTSLPDPRFTYGYFIREVETRVGPQQHRVGIAQTFPWFGKLQLRGEAATAGAAAAEQHYEAVKLDLFNDVKRSFYELYFLGRAIAITEENLGFLRQFEEIARTKYESGTALYADVIKAQVELDRLNDQSRTLRDRTRPVRAEMNTILNRPKDAPLALPRSVPVEEMAFSQERLSEWLRESNPELHRLDYLAEQEEANARLAGKEFFPDLMLGVDYTVTGAARMPGVRDSSKDPVMATVSINIPVWREKYRAGVRAAEHRRQAALREREERENSLKSRLETALFTFRDAGRKIQLYQKALVPKAEQELEVTQRAFEAGQVNFLSLIDSERALLEFKLTYERAIADRGQAKAQLEQLVGRDL